MVLIYLFIHLFLFYSSSLTDLCLFAAALFACILALFFCISWESLAITGLEHVRSKEISSKHLWHVENTLFSMPMPTNNTLAWPLTVLICCHHKQKGEQMQFYWKRIEKASIVRLDKWLITTQTTTNEKKRETNSIYIQFIKYNIQPSTATLRAPFNQLSTRY